MVDVETADELGALGAIGSDLAPIAATDVENSLTRKARVLRIELLIKIRAGLLQPALISLYFKILRPLGLSKPSVEPRQQSGIKGSNRLHSASPHPDLEVLTRVTSTSPLLTTRGFEPEKSTKAELMISTLSPGP